MHEVVEPEEQFQVADELIEILYQDLSERTYPRPLRLLVGEFDPHQLHRKRLFVVKSEDGERIEALLVCNPMLNGTGWSFETYRKRDDSPRGTIAFLFRTVIDKLQAEGAEKVSLCLVPGRGVREWKSSQSSWLVRSSLSIWYDHLNFLFNTRGQEHFKTRFRPQFENRYLCMTPRTSIPSIYSFLKTVRALSPSLPNLFRNLWRVR